MVQKMVLKSDTETDGGREEHPCYGGEKPSPPPSAHFVCAHALYITVFDIKKCTAFLKLFNNIPCCSAGCLHFLPNKRPYCG